MRTLELTIKQKYLEAICDGRKVQEFREVRPNNISKLLQLDEEGFEKEDGNGNAIPIEYDAIRFTSKEKGEEVLVEVNDTKAEIMLNAERQPIEYQYNGLTWLVERVVYDLGKIISFKRKVATKENDKENDK